MCTLNPLCPNFMDTSSISFSNFIQLLTISFRDLQTKGVGLQSRPTEVFTLEEEELLWSSGSLSTDTPMGLLRAVYFLLRALFS